MYQPDPAEAACAGGAPMTAPCGGPIGPGPPEPWN